MEIGRKEKKKKAEFGVLMLLKTAHTFKGLVKCCLLIKQKTADLSAVTNSFLVHGNET